MELLRFKQKSNGDATWYWAFEIKKTGIGFYHYTEWSDISKTMVDWKALEWTKHFLWGFDHTYYDGPHCTFSIGPLHFNWRNWTCEVCHGEEDEDQQEEH